MDYQIVAIIASIIWIVFIVVWLVSAFRAKRTIKGRPSFWLFRIAIVVIVIAAVKWDRGAVTSWLIPASNLPLQILGLVLMVIGIAIAFWARYYLGKNWGMPMSLKENPELVTGGPYDYIRNPIYSGVLLTMVGSGFALGTWWFFIAIAAGAYFIYASKQEETIMMTEFPDTYPAYKARTKMLIPFVL